MRRPLYAFVAVALTCGCGTRSKSQDEVGGAKPTDSASSRENEPAAKSPPSLPLPSSSELPTETSAQPAPLSAAECPAERQRCSVDFTVSDTTASSVELRGDFAQGAWSKGIPMTKDGTTWRAAASVRPGATVNYKYCVDPRSNGACASWKTDAFHAVVPPDQNNQIARVTCVPNACDAPATTVRFIAVGDTGKGNAGQYEVARAMDAKCRVSGCDFVVLLGDNIYESGASSVTDPLFQDRFEKPYAAIPVPFYAILGNHDYGGNGAGNEFGKEQNEVAYSAQSSKWKMPAPYYRFKNLDAEFFALDTNAQLYGNDAQQRTDVKAWLSGSTAKWKVALAHHPYRSNGPHGNAGNYDGNPNVPNFNGATVKSFAEEVVCGHADLYLSGHDHSRQWLSEPCGGTEFVVSGTGSSPTRLGGTNTTRFQSAALGFVYIVIDGKNLTAEMVETDGSTSFSRTLTK